VISQYTLPNRMLALETIEARIPRQAEPSVSDVVTVDSYLG